MKKIQSKLAKEEYKGQNIYTQCSYCKRYKGLNGEWYVAEEEHDELISHGACEGCCKKAHEQIKKYKREMRNKKEVKR